MIKLRSKIKIGNRETTKVVYLVKMCDTSNSGKFTDVSFYWLFLFANNYSIYLPKTSEQIKIIIHNLFLFIGVDKSRSFI